MSRDRDNPIWAADCWMLMLRNGYVPRFRPWPYWDLPPRHPRRRQQRRRELLAAKSTVEHAATILDSCTRGELRDHAFGDCEVNWERNGIDVGWGYFGGEERSVTVRVGRGLNHRVTFRGGDAEALRCRGMLVGVGRNDSTGPDRYREGACMPGLTLGGVLAEVAMPTCKEGGPHHWLKRGDCEDFEGNWIDAYFRCADCRVTAIECDGCGELIDPSLGGHACEYGAGEPATSAPRGVA